LNKNGMILTLLLVFSFVGLSFGQTDNNTSDTDTVSANESLLADTASSPNQAAPSLNFIWSFTGIESDPITIAINQEGSDLFGQAKYEPEGGKAWNADVVGSVRGDEVELTMTAQKEEGMVTIKMTGTYANDAINGNFTTISGGKKMGSGPFSAMWINPDTSSYTPAVIEEPKAETPAPAVTNTTTDASQTTTESTTETQQTASRFVDVRQYKDKIGPGGDLSGIPPGMGGSGL